jgi:ABC-2 type transport system ATP-binding protein
VIRAERLTKRFGDWLALDALDLDVKEGEVFGLLGPNGAGKTTAIRLLTGLVAPTTGRAHIAGVDVAAQPERVRGLVGLLTETPGLYVRLDAIENLMFYARVYDIPEPMKKIEAILKRLGLWERRREASGAFSKGMRQKLAIARAILHDPKVLFLDEPTSALDPDPESAKTVRALIGELRDEGRTIVLCTHNLDEADRLSHRIGVLRRGKLVHVGTPAALRHGLYGRATRVTLTSDARPHVDLVRSLAFATDVSVEGCVLRVSLDAPEEQNPVLIRALVGAGADVVTVAEESRALEDVYLDLVREDAPAAGSTP